MPVVPPAGIAVRAVVIRVSFECGCGCCRGVFNFFEGVSEFLSSSFPLPVCRSLRFLPANGIVVKHRIQSTEPDGPDMRAEDGGTGLALREKKNKK